MYDCRRTTYLFFRATSVTFINSIPSCQGHVSDKNAKEIKRYCLYHTCLLIHKLTSNMTFMQYIFLFTLILNHTSAFHIHGVKIARPSPLGSKDTFLPPSNNIPLYSTGSEYDGGTSRNGSSVTPRTFREAEVLGLRLMQEGQIEEALKGSYG